MRISKDPTFIILFMFLSLLFLWFIVMGKAVLMQDIFVYQKAGIELVKGRNPYALPPLNSYYDFKSWRIGGFDGLDSKLQVWIPPFSLFIPMLLTFIPQTLLPLLNYCLLIICQFVSVFIARTIYPDIRSIESQRISFVYLAFMIPAFYNYLLWGSINSFETLPWLFFLLAFMFNKDILAGVCLALCSFKPQLILIPAMISIIAGYKLLNKQLIVTTLFATLLLWAFPLLMDGDVISQYLAIDKSIMTRHAKSAVTLPRILSGGDLGFSWVISLCLLGAGIYLCYPRHSIQNRIELVKTALSFSVLGLIGFPYLWLHDYLICSPIFMITSGIVAVDLNQRTFGFCSKIISACLIFNLIYFTYNPSCIGFWFDCSWLLCMIAVLFLMKKVFNAQSSLRYG